MGVEHALFASIINSSTPVPTVIDGLSGDPEHVLNLPCLLQLTNLQVIDLEGLFLDRGKAFLLAWHVISNVNIKSSSLPTRL